MGYFFPGAPPYLINWGAANLPDASAVETGTYFGDSAVILGSAFASCTTIELDPELATKAAARFSTDPRVTVVQGSSRAVLPGILGELDSPPFVWLDAHFSGGITAGSDDPCPVLAEIEAISSAFGADAVVAIDDARIFGIHSPSDAVNRDWPSLLEVLACLADTGQSSFVIDDVIVGVPPRLGDSLAELATSSWMNTRHARPPWRLRAEKALGRARSRYAKAFSPKHPVTRESG